jgi:putative endopeptidase
MTSFRNTALISLFACTLALSAAPADQNTSTRDSTQDIDRSVKASDDFYHYANGGWLRTAVIPAGQTSYDTRSILVARTSQRVRDLIQEAAAGQPEG